MAPTRKNTNPREALAGWRLYPQCAWSLLALNLLVPAASWLPVDWAAARAILQLLGCFAGGMLLASSGAIWQRTDETMPAAYPTTGRVASATPTAGREALAGWRIHPAAARTLLVLAIGGIAWLALGPKEWMVLRAAGTVLGSFAAGALAARDAAIWQRSKQLADR